MPAGLKWWRVIGAYAVAYVLAADEDRAVALAERDASMGSDWCLADEAEMPTCISALAEGVVASFAE